MKINKMKAKELQINSFLQTSNAHFAITVYQCTTDRQSTRKTEGQQLTAVPVAQLKISTK